MSAVTIADLQTLLNLGTNALEVQKLLRPGTWPTSSPIYCGNANTAQPSGLQRSRRSCSRKAGKRKSSPLNKAERKTRRSLTIDSAMLLVDEALRIAGALHGCTREEVEAAFAYLTSPNIGAATRSPDGPLVILRR